MTVRYHRFVIKIGVAGEVYCLLSTVAAFEFRESYDSFGLRVMLGRSNDRRPKDVLSNISGIVGTSKTWVLALRLENKTKN